MTTLAHMYQLSPVRQDLRCAHRRALETASDCAPQLNAQIGRLSIARRNKELSSHIPNASDEIEKLLTQMDQLSEEEIEALIWDLLEEDDGL